MENEPIDPCPWCESENVDIGEEESCNGIRYFVFCGNCDMTGPFEEIQVNAVLAWNFLKRAVVEWNKVKDGGCCIDGE